MLSDEWARDLMRNERGFPVHPKDPGEPGATTGTGGPVPRWGVHPGEAEILARLAVGRDVLEIGTGLGISTRAMASTAMSVVTVDIDPWVHETVWPDLRRDCLNVYGYADREKIDPEFRCSMAFVDGRHTRENAADDIRFCLTRLHGPSLLVLHDACMIPVRKGLFDVLPGSRLWIVPAAQALGLVFV